MTAPIVKPMLLIAAAALLHACAAQTSTAEENSPEAEYLRYHRAIRAAELCEDRKFGNEAHSRMARYIDEQVANQIGAGRRLSLIEQAKSEAEKLIGQRNCDTPGAIELLGLFHAELEPQLP